MENPHVCSRCLGVQGFSSERMSFFFVGVFVSFSVPYHQREDAGTLLVVITW